MRVTKELLRDWLLMALGVTLVAGGGYFFKFPNHFSIGGVSGLSILLGQVITIPWLTPTVCNTILTVAFLVLGFEVLDSGFGVRTTVCSLAYTGLMQVFEWIYPMDGPLTNELLLELFFAVLIPAVGSAILFNLNASTGGTEIIAMILKKYTGLDVGRALLISDVLIAAAALFLFNITAGLCALLGLALKSVMVDSCIESLNRRKAFFVITSMPNLACRYITEELGRGATVWDAKGAYTQQENQVVLTVLTRAQAISLRRYLRMYDRTCFMIVANSSEIFGKGFMRA